eukprot:4537789-Amphidinium_carterae.1
MSTNVWLSHMSPATGQRRLRHHVCAWCTGTNMTWLQHTTRHDSGSSLRRWSKRLGRRCNVEVPAPTQRTGTSMQG